MRALEEARLVLRTVFPEVPPRVEYRLTDDGLRLRPVVEVMREFGLWLKSRAVLNRNEHRTKINRTFSCSFCFLTGC